MAENKKSFLLYKEWIDPISELTDNEAGELFMCILKYVNNEPYDVKESFEGLFYAIQEQIVYEWSKFNPLTEKYHWNYKGGITPKNKAIRNSAQIKFWRTKVFERDNFTCQKCKCKGGKLNAHHIKPFALFPHLRTELSNGITLCETCHKEEHKKVKL